MKNDLFLLSLTLWCACSTPPAMESPCVAPRTYPLHLYKNQLVVDFCLDSTFYPIEAGIENAGADASFSFSNGTDSVYLGFYNLLNTKYLSDTAALKYHDLYLFKHGPSEQLRLDSYRLITRDAVSGIVVCSKQFGGYVYEFNAIDTASSVSCKVYFLTNQPAGEAYTNFVRMVNSINYSKVTD